MGYTQYFTITDKATPEMYKAFSDEAHEILRSAEIYKGIQLADGMGEELSAWQADDERVMFNGFGDDAHETFLVTPNSLGFNFCKTARKPYDAVVVACLISLGRIYGDAVEIGSDGDHADWSEGAALYQMAVQRTAIIPLPYPANA